MTHTHRIRNNNSTAPGPDPSIAQQLIDGHLFRGQMTSQEVHGVPGQVRREDHAGEIRTATTLQYLKHK